MDIVLEIADFLVLDQAYSFGAPLPMPSVHATCGGMLPISPKPYVPASQYLPLGTTKYTYASSLDRDNIYRQVISLYMITWTFGILLYFLFGGLSYFFVFDHATFKHPKYLDNQIWLEIKQALTSMPGMSILTAICFVAEVRGHSKLYDTFEEAPFSLYNLLQFPFFLCFTDLFVYWIHRGLHHPRVYKTLHKSHHKWIMPTPFASHAFHPLDGFAQGIPYHVFPFIFPLQKGAYVGLFFFINVWTIIIHDGEYVVNSPVINGAACHTIHHLYFNYNYGQFTTVWDRLGGSYRKPNDELFIRESKMSREEWARQTKEMEKIQQTVENEDDRHYGSVKKTQ